MTVHHGLTLGLGEGCLCPSPQEQQEIFFQRSGLAELDHHIVMEATTARTYLFFLSVTIVGLVLSLQRYKSLSNSFFNLSKSLNVCLRESHLEILFSQLSRNSRYQTSLKGVFR